MTIMRLFLLLLALISATSAQTCEPPSKGCTYGMFNTEKCVCECIKPFCPDANGDCVVPTDNCGGNPWEDCTRGVDCPWWGSLTSEESCNTGSEVPPGVWAIYNTRKICCGVHSPYSTVCNQKGPNGPANFDLSTVPDRKEVALKFELTGLPDDIDKSKLEENILNSLKIILTQLKDREPDLQVTDIVERACTGRKLDEQKRLRFTGRELRDASVCFTVEVMNNDNKKDYDGLIVNEALASIDIILNQIRTKFNAVNVNLGMAGMGNQNVSGSPNGGGSNSGGGNSNVGSSSNGGSNTMGNDMKDGLPWWAILLIVLLVLVLTCWIGFCIYAAVRDSRDDKDVNILFNNYPIGHTANKRGGNSAPSSLNSSVPSRRRRKSFAERGSQAFRRSFARGGGRPRNTRDRPHRRDDGRKRNGQRDRFDRFRSSFTNVAGRPRRYRENSRDNGNPTVSFNNNWDRKPTEESVISLQNNAQDPPMNAMVLYEPDKTKPDPDGVSAGVVVLALTNGEEPGTKPKLEPEETHYASASVSPALPDPSVAQSLNDFVQPQQALYGARDNDYDEDYEDEEEDEEEEYDQYGFRRSQPEIVMPQRGEDSLSFVTSDPEEIKKRLKAKKKKKKKRRQYSSSDESRRKDNDSNSTSDGNRSYRRKRSGVDSLATDDESYELYSRASA